MKTGLIVGLSVGAVAIAIGIPAGIYLASALKEPMVERIS